MKRIRIAILLLVFMWPALACFCQPDSLLHAEEESGFRVADKFSDRSKAWYVNASGSYSKPDYLQELSYRLGVSFEYKLGNSHSLGAGLNVLMFDKEPLFSPYPHRTFGVKVNLEYRYYHNLKGRMSRGLTGNNFNADYFLFSPALSFGYEPYTLQGYQWDFNTGTWIVSYKSSFKAIPDLRLGYGIQRSIGKSFNYDINGGFQIQRMSNLKSPLSLIYFQLGIRYIFK
ncbi:MAG TPA: hypothetical protein VJ203_11195 [Bacteroidales bacterium]|nr:hypothetical protein [Bacteroidales bacterium]